MAAPTIGNTDTTAPAWLNLRRRGVPGRLIVLGDSVSEVVTMAGGWLFDRGSAGCRATVFLTGHDDDRALRILGTEAVQLETASLSEACDSQPDTLTVAADLFRRDAWVRNGVLAAIAEGFANVMMWGDPGPTEDQWLATSVEHRLSVGARAFKKQALTAVGAPSDSALLVEAFCAITSSPPAEERPLR